MHQIKSNMFFLHSSWMNISFSEITQCQILYMLSFDSTSQLFFQTSNQSGKKVLQKNAKKCQNFCSWLRHWNFEVPKFMVNWESFAIETDFTVWPLLMSFPHFLECRNNWLCESQCNEFCWEFAINCEMWPVFAICSKNTAIFCGNCKI